MLGWPVEFLQVTQFVLVTSSLCVGLLIPCNGCILPLHAAAQVVAITCGAIALNIGSRIAGSRAWDGVSSGRQTVCAPECFTSTAHPMLLRSCLRAHLARQHVFEAQRLLEAALQRHAGARRGRVHLRGDSPHTGFSTAQFPGRVLQCRRSVR